MAWLDDRLRDHPKIIRASAPAFKAWALALCYCSAHGTEGRLDQAIRALAVPRKTVDELVELRLWDRETDGLWVHDWQEHNDKRDQTIEERRAQARERQRRHRERVRSQNLHEQTTDPRDNGVTVTRDVSRDVTRDEGVTSLAGARPRHARDHDQEELQAAAASQPTDETAAAATRLRLDNLGLNLNIPDHDLPRATAWLDLADHEAATNPAGYVRRGLDSGAWPSPRAGSYSEKTRANGEVDWETKARELFARTADREQVADWLAGLTRVPEPERERILVAVAGPEGAGADDEPDFGDEP